MVSRLHSRKYGPRPTRQFYKISLAKYLAHLSYDRDRAIYGIYFPKRKVVNVEEELINRPFKYRTVKQMTLKESYKKIDNNIMFYFKIGEARYVNLDTAEIYRTERGRQTTYLLLDGGEVTAYDIQRKEYRHEKDIWMECDDNYFQTYKKTYKTEKRKVQLRRGRNKRWEAKEKIRVEEKRRIRALKREQREEREKGVTNGHNFNTTVQD